MRYKTAKWQRKRGIVLRRDGYLCRECKRYGKHTPAECVHHVYPAEHWPELIFHDVNLISLCNNCHNKMHDRETHEISVIGKDWQQRIKPKIWGTTEAPPPSKNIML